MSRDGFMAISKNDFQVLTQYLLPMARAKKPTSHWFTSWVVWKQPKNQIQLNFENTCFKDITYTCFRDITSLVRAPWTLTMHAA